MSQITTKTNKTFAGIILTLALLALHSSPASAHIFETAVAYVPPLPFWMYLWGGGAALILSFIVTAFFVTSHKQNSTLPTINLSRCINNKLAYLIIFFCKIITFAALVATVYFGYVGPSEPGKLQLNLGLTLFWIIFFLGFVYIVFLFGNVYEWLNPWKNIHKLVVCIFTCFIYALNALQELVTKKRPLTHPSNTTNIVSRLYNGILHYPRWLGYWPAFLFYVGLIWVELLGKFKPADIADLLLIYSAVNLVGASVFGIKHWFTKAELFSVFFHLIGLMSPLHWSKSRSSNDMTLSKAHIPKHQLKLRWPFVGLVQESTKHFSLLMFILFMLSSTVFDGLHETKVWNDFYRQEMYEWLFKDWLTGNIFKDNAALILNRHYWQMFCLLISPLIYLLIYWLFIWLTKCIGGGTLSTKQTAFRFAYSLLPIALVYNITHYFLLSYSQSLKIFSILSDPFDTGADWLGTKMWFYSDQGINNDSLWHFQVILIVLGHVAGVVVAHKEALKIYSKRWRAIASQLPMLVLMVLFTVAGLWVLTLPLKGG